MKIELSSLQSEHLHVLSNLWQFYIFEGSVRDQTDVDADGRFEIPDELFTNAAEGKDGSSVYLILCDGSYAGFVVLASASIAKKPITELADLFILPKYRGQGIASTVIENIIIQSSKTWLIAVFRNDLEALRFWKGVFNRLPFSSYREIIPPELPEFHEFVVNEATPNNSFKPNPLRGSA